MACSASTPNATATATALAASLWLLRWAWPRFPECTAARFRGRRPEVHPGHVLATGLVPPRRPISYHSAHLTRASCTCGYRNPGTDTQHTAFGPPRTHISSTVKAHAPGQKEHTQSTTQVHLHTSGTSEPPHRTQFRTAFIRLAKDMNIFHNTANSTQHTVHYLHMHTLQTCILPRDYTSHTHTWS